MADGVPATNTGLIGDLALLCHFLAVPVFLVCLALLPPGSLRVIPNSALALLALALSIAATVRGGRDRRTGRVALGISALSMILSWPVGYALLAGGLD